MQRKSINNDTNEKLFITEVAEDNVVNSHNKNNVNPVHVKLISTVSKLQ